jgi:hypothetical protein
VARAEPEVAQVRQPEPVVTASREPIIERRPEPAPVVARVEEPRREEPRRVEEQRQPTEIRRTEEPRRAEPVIRPAEASGLRGSLGIDRREPATPILKPATEPAPRREEGQGWISDLLRSASREENTPETRANPASTARPDSRNPRHVVESLNSLSVDIARAIDHDASVDLWRRYQRGERDVFTRRLYTLKGQQTFDEIKRKYDREPEFRTAVDRYINDFEKLLADVSRNDRDKSLTQSYLTSDTGKVYTMLAHAAGRFS